jgi:Sec-independent protein translocase protein TatA
MIVAMGATGDDEERTGYGARRGWRAPKGAGPARSGGRRRGRGRDDRATHPRASPTTEASPVPGTLAAHVARLSRLPPEDAAALAREDLPAPGAPDALPAAFRALGRLLTAARDAAETARRQAEETAERRARDAARARTQVARAQERETRQREKASAEQGERQRLVGELERTQARLSQVAAERDRLRAPHADGVARSGDAAHDDAEVAGLLARVFDLEAQLEERAVALEELTDAREAAEAERDHLVTSARRLRRLALEAGATDVDLVDPEDAAPLRADELPEVRTVLQAVELAAAHAEHLVYTDRAFSSARTAPYTEPQKLLRDLVALDRVAAAWDVETGIGRPIRDVALEQQLDWADDVSDTARGQNAREYQFSHQGRPLWAGPHVRVATGRGLQRTCRVYLALVKGTEPDLAGLPRGVYVGPVGRHLSDSTSG